MQNLCLHPRWLPQQRIWADCGHCRACRIKKRLEWSTRISDEIRSTGRKALFVTLTYDEEHINGSRSLSKHDLQSYFKRLRYYGLQFKYFAAGEYGPRTNRPHYHIIFIGLTKADVRIIFQAWGKCRPVGFRAKQITDTRCIKYTCGYTAKKLGSHYNARFIRQNPGRIPEFQLSSSGIGKAFALAVLKDTPYLYRDGHETIPPRYYRKITGHTAEEYIPLIYAQQQAIFKQILAANPNLIYHPASVFTGKYIYAGMHVYGMFFTILQTYRRECDDRLYQSQKEWRCKL